MLISPKTRYGMTYKDLQTLTTAVVNAGYQAIGFGRLDGGDIYLARTGYPDAPSIDEWHQPFRSTGAYIKLSKLPHQG